MSIESVILSSPLILSHSLFLLPSIFPSIEGKGNLSCESALYIRWTEYWSFSFSISPSNEYSGLISHKVDWFDLLAVQGTLKNPPAPHFENVNSSALFHVQLQLLLLDPHTGFSGIGKVVWYSLLFKNFPQFVVIHTVKGFSVVNEAEVDVFLELSCFFYDPTDVGNLIFGSSAFSKSSLNI